MDTRGRYFYKGSCPGFQIKPFPSDIGLESMMRKHAVTMNVRSPIFFIQTFFVVILPSIFLTKFLAKTFNKSCREEQGINTHWVGWRPPVHWNAPDNPLPVFENPVYDEWLAKQKRLMEKQRQMRIEQGLSPEDQGPQYIPSDIRNLGCTTY